MAPHELCDTFEPYFVLDSKKLREIVDRFQYEFDGGLSEYGKDMAMVPSFVTGVPDGTEEGTFLALDLGGTNLRVCEVQLHGKHQFSIKQQKYKVSDELKQGQARILFDYIADSVDAFLSDIGSDFSNQHEPLHLGFTFSFPVEQTAIDAGKLLTWTKGFNAKNAIGHDVVRMLQDAFDKKHIHVRVSALVNDTVGTLLSRSYQSGPALIGCIFGTGTNGAYIDRTRKITKLGKEQISKAEEGGPHAGQFMVINTEWGAMDNSRHCLPVTLFDNKLDRESINPRRQAFEKMVSGMYLGEVVRNVLLHFIDLNLLFGGYSSEILNTHYGFDASFVSKVEGTPSEKEVEQIIVAELKISASKLSKNCASLVMWACKMVANRACALAACAIAAVILHTGNDKTPDGEEDTGVDVGVDGSVAEFLPDFEPRVRSALKEILGEKGEKRVRIGLAKDGSGVGAALSALQAKKAMDKRKADQPIAAGKPNPTGQTGSQPVHQ